MGEGSSFKLTASLALDFVGGVSDFNNTTAGSVTPQSRIDNGGGTAYTGLDRYSVCYTILGASSAFHAGVLMVDFGKFIAVAKNGMRANNFTHAATDAFLFIKL